MLKNGDGYKTAIVSIVKQSRNQTKESVGLHDMPEGLDTSWQIKALRVKVMLGVGESDYEVAVEKRIH